MSCMKLLDLCSMRKVVQIGEYWKVKKNKIWVPINLVGSPDPTIKLDMGRRNELINELMGYGLLFIHSFMDMGLVQIHSFLPNALWIDTDE